MLSGALFQNGFYLNYFSKLGISSAAIAMLARHTPFLNPWSKKRVGEVDFTLYPKSFYFLPPAFINHQESSKQGRKREVIVLGNKKGLIGEDKP
jgi:hypothetical protein